MLELVILAPIDEPKHNILWSGAGKCGGYITVARNMLCLVVSGEQKKGDARSPCVVLLALGVIHR